MWLSEISTTFLTQLADSQYVTTLVLILVENLVSEISILIFN
jgi:hypothetical protein